jgi:hypothetical protein
MLVQCGAESKQKWPGELVLQRGRQNQAPRATVAIVVQGLSGQSSVATRCWKLGAQPLRAV